MAAVAPRLIILPVDATGSPQRYDPSFIWRPLPPGQMESNLLIHHRVARELRQGDNLGVDFTNMVYNAPGRYNWYCTGPANSCGHHRWPAALRDRVRPDKPSGCPFCRAFGNARRVCPCNSFARLHPEKAAEMVTDPRIIDEWIRNHPEDSDIERVRIDVHTLSEHSNYKYLWKCGNTPYGPTPCGCHYWTAKISNRTRPQYDGGCPFAGCAVPCKKVCPHGSVAGLAPDIARELVMDPNIIRQYMLSNPGIKLPLVVNPQNIAPGSNDIYLWKCLTGNDGCSCHYWHAMVSNRTKNGSGCPFIGCCHNGTKFCHHSSLGYKHSQLTKELVPKEGLNPFAIPCNDKREYEWKCPDEKCGYIYMMSVSERTAPSQMRSCPACTFSKMEAETLRICEELKIKCVPQKTYSGCRDKGVLRFDHYYPEYNLLHENDGSQHFKPREIWGGEEGLEDRKRKDSIKTEFARTNNINLLRISQSEARSLYEHLTKTIEEIKNNPGKRIEKFFGKEYQNPVAQG